MENSTIIRKTTQKGQITLPAKFRRKINTNYYTIEDQDDCLVLRPIITNDNIICNAKRNNQGKSLSTKGFLKPLTKNCVYEKFDIKKFDKFQFTDKSVSKNLSKNIDKIIYQ